MTFELINTLTESRAFASGRQFDRLTVDDATGFLYLSLLLLYIYRVEGIDWGKTYIRRTRAFNNYDYFRNSGTDLYMLSYLLLGNHDEYARQDELERKVRFSKGSFDRFLDSISLTEPSEGYLRQYFYSLETQLRISNGHYKALRRNVLLWNTLPDEKKVHVLNEIEKAIKRYYYAAEVLDKIYLVREKYE